VNRTNMTTLVFRRMSVKQAHHDHRFPCLAVFQDAKGTHSWGREVRQILPMATSA
jgi:hypothetical protein